MASFYVIRGKDNGQHFAIRGAKATIGREAVNQIQLHDTEVSRQHARIIRTGGAEYEIVDNNSSNGTFVNSRRIQSQVLRSGDRVQVGRTLLIFTGGPEPYSSRALDAVEIVSHDQQDELSQIRSSIESLLPPKPTDLPSQVVQLPVDLRNHPADSSSLHEDSSRSKSSAGDSSVVVPTGGLPNSLAESRLTRQDAGSWEIVYQVSQAIHRTVDLNELMTQVLDLIFQWIECDRGCVLMLDDVSGTLTPVYSRDRKQTKGNLTKPKPLTISRTILDHVVATKEGVLTCDAQDDSRWQHAESVTSLGVHEAICVPMLGRYGLVGAIYVDTSMSAGVYAERRGASSFDDEHLKLMLAIAGQAAMAVEDTQFYRAMVQSERLAAMGQTIANLSHHVKNILQGISGGNYLVEEGLKKSDLGVVRRGWTIVERNQSRISNLVMDMLSFSKEREPVLEHQDVRNLIDDVVELTQTRAEDGGVKLIWSRPADALEAEFDPEALHRAVLNVLSNAVDATLEMDAEIKPPLVNVSAKLRDTNITITVTDNGPGIPEADQLRVFSPFESSKGARGTGLGLPVSQKILREHGGDISFDSQPGVGTTFLLWWPAHPAGNGNTGAGDTDNTGNRSARLGPPDFGSPNSGPPNSGPAAPGPADSGPATQLG